VDYLPPVFRGFREFLAIMDGEQPTVEKLYEDTNRVLDEQFIASADEYGLSRWEKSLGIFPKASETYEDRRFRLATLMSSKLPYTIRALEGQLEALCGAGNYSLEVDAINFQVIIFVALSVKNNYDVVKQMLDKILPANLYVHLSLKYNQHFQYEGIEHGEMAAFTHYQLRNEVLT